MLPQPNQAGCSTSNGGCKTCPNAPKTPTEWWYSLPLATRALLKLIVGFSVAMSILARLFPSMFEPSSSPSSSSLLLGLDEVSGMATFAPRSAASNSGSFSLLSSIIIPLFQYTLAALLVIPRLVFDFRPVISIAFLFDVYLFATFMSKVEVDIMGGHVVDFFEFPAKDLFTATQLATMRDSESRRGNIFVRSLRTLWCYLQLCAALFISFWLICAPFYGVMRLFGFGGGSDEDNSAFSFLWEAARPTHSIVTTLSAVWCFMAPAETLLKLPFSGLIASSSATKPRGQQEEERRRSSASSDGSVAGGVNAQDNQNGNTAAAAAATSARESTHPSEARTNASYGAYINSTRKSSSSPFADGVKARHYPYAMLFIRWLMSGGSILFLLREFVAIKVVAELFYVRLLKDRALREKNLMPQQFVEVLDKFIVGRLLGTESFLVKVVAQKVIDDGLLCPLRSAYRRYVKGGGGANGGAAAAVSPSSDYTAVAFISSLRSLLYSSYIFSFIPRHSLDVPRPICRWVRRVLVTDHVDRLREKGALTPWAKY